MRSGRFRDELRWFSRTIPAPRNISALRDRIGRLPGGAILESVSTDPARGRYSIFTAEPVCILKSDRSTPLDPFKQFGAVTRYPFDCGLQNDMPFVGGWIGYLAYEAAQYTESRSGIDEMYREAPLSHWALYDSLILYDRDLQKWSVIGCHLPEDLLEDGLRTPVEERARRLEAIAASSPGAPTMQVRRSSQPTGEWNYSREAYLKKVRRILQYIRAGDIYQANLARRFRAHGHIDAVDLYQRLCECNPAPYAACIDTADATIISSSPELFLSVHHGGSSIRGRDVVTRPIKGTRPRGLDAAGDEAAVLALVASEKDRAELNMIIDLERNDLGRVCEFGSVKVVHDGEIEANPTVFHRTATIQGRLREDADAIDLLRACFPGGSITGAPKVRAMQIIREMEPHPRGPYCGAIGYIGLNGDVQLNLAIRTMISHADGVDLFVGSGIVADSIPEEEFDELEAKAAGMMNALASVPIYDPNQTRESRAVHV